METRFHHSYCSKTAQQEIGSDTRHRLGASTPVAKGRSRGPAWFEACVYVKHMAMVTTQHGWTQKRFEKGSLGECPKMPRNGGRAPFAMAFCFPPNATGLGRNMA